MMDKLFLIVYSTYCIQIYKILFHLTNSNDRVYIIYIFIEYSFFVSQNKIRV